MTKYTNPFHTFTEAQAILKSLGANTSCNIPVNAERIDWRENVLSIMVDKCYAPQGHYFKMSIHLNAEGYDELVRTLENSFEEQTLSLGGNDTLHSIEIGPGLTISKVVLGPVEPRTENGGGQ